MSILYVLNLFFLYLFFSVYDRCAFLQTRKYSSHFSGSQNLIANEIYRIHCMLFQYPCLAKFYFQDSSIVELILIGFETLYFSNLQSMASCILENFLLRDRLVISILLQRKIMKNFLKVTGKLSDSNINAVTVRFEISWLTLYPV